MPQSGMKFENVNILPFLKTNKETTKILTFFPMLYVNMLE